MHLRIFNVGFVLLRFEFVLNSVDRRSKILKIQIP